MTFIDATDKSRVAPIYPQTKVTAEDWIAAAKRTLIEEGEESVRVLPLAQKLGVSRASFYWYFENRDDLLERLLALWREKNTKGIVDKARQPAATIGSAILNLFECWVDETLFDPRFDFAIREWARRSPGVKTLLRSSDDERLGAIEAMFARHGFGAKDAKVRARVIYLEQIGHYSLEIEESQDTKLGMLSAYIRAFSGTELRASEKRRFAAIVERLEARGARQTDGSEGPSGRSAPVSVASREAS